MLFGLIGYPISRSFSRPYFTEKFTGLGLETTHEYRNFELEDISFFPDIIKLHPDLRGLNVTIPHKQAVMQYLDEIDPAAAAIGAVNTILVQHGKTKGFNTDIIGFQNDFIDFAGYQSSKADQNLTADYAKGRIQVGEGTDAPGSRHGRKTLDYRALVLGTGGASLAILQALEELSIPTTIVSRSPAPGRITYEQISADVIKVHRFIINCTPLGSRYRIDEAPNIPYNQLTEKHYCYDLVYDPEVTLFLQRAKVRGASIRNGSGMLSGQAEAAWDIWR